MASNAFDRVGDAQAELKAAGASNLKATDSATKDAKSTQAIVEENTKLKAKPDPAISRMKLWGGIACGLGVALFVASFFAGSIPLVGSYLGSYGRAGGIGLIVTGILLIGIAIYLTIIFWGAVAIAAVAGVIYILAHKGISTASKIVATVKDNANRLDTHAAIISAITTPAEPPPNPTAGGK